jgi:uncharacterized protein
MSATDRFVSASSGLLMQHRKLLAALFTAITLAFGYSASSVKLDPGFLKLIPVKHEYMRTMMEYLKDFSGANTLLINLRWKGDGDLYNAEFMEALRKATDDVFFIPGINRPQVSSLYTPNTWYIEITEDGFKGEPVVPARFSGTPEQLDRVRHNVGLSGQIGLIVSNDQKSAMIRASLLEVDTRNPAEAEAVFRRVMTRLADIRGRFESPEKYVYRLRTDRPPLQAGAVIAEGYSDLGWMQRFQTFYISPEDGADFIAVSGADVETEVLPNPDYNEKIEVNIIGFAQLLADVISGLVGVFGYFALAFLITAVLLFIYCGSVRIALVALFVATLPVLWLIGVLPLIGYGIDPMSILVPFLIFAIGVSHAVQMTSVWRQEVLAGKDSKAAARASFENLFIPGTVALLTEALGFGVIMLISIPIVHELGITACLGVLLMIITNKMILPIILSYTTLEESSRRRGLAATREGRHPVIHIIGAAAEPRVALWIFAGSLAMLAVATWQSRSLVIGDSGRGVPELHADSRYNLDNDFIGDHYNIGTDVLTVIVEAPDFEGDSCLHYPVIDLVDRFELFARGIDGVQSVTSVAGIGKLVIGAFNEGNPRWRALPRSQAGLSTGSKGFDPNLGLNTEGCKAIQVLIFTRNHDGNTVAHVVREIKRFIAGNPVEGVKLRLATGNVGVMAATNEAVGAAEITMILAIFGSLVLFCYATFRSWIGVLCVMIPLVVVTVCCNGLMSALDIGLKVATLPVIALGVGVGVDYGLYLYERIQHHLADPAVSFREAFERSMVERGSAAVFTALTMSIGVATWTLSALKFQGDMGLLLAFMFLVNMLGAICLLPALGTWFFRNRSTAGARA